MEAHVGATQHAPRRADWLVCGKGPLAASLADLSDGAVVRHVGSALEFARALAVERPRLAILFLPPGDADDLRLLAQERLRRPRLSAVAVTEGDAVDMRLLALQLGLDDAFARDIDPAELRGRLALLAERGRMPRRDGRRLPVGEDVELDLAAHELRRRGQIVHLRPKEFRLLLLLAQHPGRAFTRRQLLDRVWGPEHEGDPRTVDVHVRWLREKVERDPESPSLLRTVHGVGYRYDRPEPMDGDR